MELWLSGALITVQPQISTYELMAIRCVTLKDFELPKIWLTFLNHLREDDHATQKVYAISK